MLRNRLQNRYLVVNQIGQGAWDGLVATDQRFGSTVALKETRFGAEPAQASSARRASS